MILLEQPRLRLNASTGEPKPVRRSPPPPFEQSLGLLRMMLGTFMQVIRRATHCRFLLLSDAGLGSPLAAELHTFAVKA